MHFYIINEALIKNKYQPPLLKKEKIRGGGGGKEEEWTTYQNTVSYM